MIPTVAQVTEMIEDLAPREVSLADDPVGMQCGKPSNPVRRIVFALDASESTVDQALAFKADLLVTHHPLLFRPVGQGMDNSPVGIAFVKALRGNLSVYSAHTNLDASPVGINSHLAELLQMSQTRTLLQTGPDSMYKVVVYVPQKDLAAVRGAAFGAGAGRIGNYSHCSFAVKGEGTFLGDDTTRPVVGSPGSLETVSEIRLEIPASAASLGTVLDAVRESHPYEEPAIDVVPLVKQASGFGLGLTGLMPSRVSIGEIAVKLKKATGANTMRLVGNRGRKVRRVAICAGSGSSLLEQVVDSGAELFITGDVKFHEARTAEDKGLSILDVGHFASEIYGMIRFTEVMEEKFKDMGWKVKIQCAKEKDPFKPVG